MPMFRHFEGAIHLAPTGSRFKLCFEHDFEKLELIKAVVYFGPSHKAPDGKPIKKPTTLIASASELLEPFQNLRCLGRHTHATTWGHGPVLSKAQTWIWQVAERIVEGNARLRRRLRHLAYPAAASGPEDPPQESTEDWSKCPACRGNMAKQ